MVEGWGGGKRERERVGGRVGKGGGREQQWEWKLSGGVFRWFPLICNQLPPQTQTTLPFHKALRSSGLVEVEVVAANVANQILPEK